MSRRRPPPRSAPSARDRLHWLDEAARQVVEHGIRDPHVAFRRAAERLGLRDAHAQPDPRELEHAVLERQRLFGSAAQPLALAARRRTALEAMAFLHRYQPRLVGPVLDGSADAHAPVELHVFCDDPDELVRDLDGHGIPHDTGTRRFRYNAERVDVVPTCRFMADGIALELAVFPLVGLRQAPRVAGTDRAMARATPAAVRALLDAPGDAGPDQPRRSSAT